MHNKDKQPHEQEPHMQATTIRLKLISLNRFSITLMQMSIYIGLNMVEFGRLRGMISQCKGNLEDLLRKRGQKIKDFKSNILLNSNSMKTYGDSKHTVEISKLFNDLKENPEEQFISIYNATDMRNYLMCVLTIVNCPRALNLINIPLENIEKGQRIQHFQMHISLKIKNVNCQ